MAQLLDFTIVTYERSPGKWRAAFTPIRPPRNIIAGAVHSLVTPIDYDSEAKAKIAAEKAIKEIGSAEIR
jgi:hypothetical protein